MNFWMTVLAVIVAQEIHGVIMVAYSLWRNRKALQAPPPKYPPGYQ